MNSMEEESHEMRVKKEPICDNLSITDKRKASSRNNQTKSKSQSMKVKEEPIDSEKSLIESMTEEVEEKFSAREEFANKTSIAFLNEETTQNATTNTNQEA